VRVEPGERGAVLWASAYFFSLLCGYYILRPMRDAMGIAGGVEALPWLFTATFLAMLAVVPLYGWVTARYPRRRFLPLVYAFFISHLVVFHLLLRDAGAHAHAARAFFVWTSVFNLFVVSVFWSFMADLFTAPQAARLFGLVAAGGTAGALAGPALASALVRPLGAPALLLVSAGFLAGSVLCIHRLLAWSAAHAASRAPGDRHRAEDGPLGGRSLAALALVARSPYLLGIAGFMLLFTTASTVLYFQQAELVGGAFATTEDRAAVLAAVDLAVNALTVVVQTLLTGRIVRALGVGGALMLVPALLGVGFTALALAPGIAVLLAVQVLRRAGDYAVTRPARELLFVVLGREEKYKAKGFLDTAVYRAGDAASAWAYAGVAALGAGVGGIALGAVPVAGLWAWLAWRLGRRQEALAAAPAAGRKEEPWSVRTDP
jgi:AAA family ATP:ADP antiporter